MNDQISVGELARQVRDVLLRFQTLAERLDNTYVSKEVLGLWEKLTESRIKAIEGSLVTKAEISAVTDLKADLEKKADQSEISSIDARVKSLEDNQKWVVRLVLGLILVAVISAVLVTSGGTGT